MGSKRSAARMERLRERLYAGMAERGITGDIADEMFVKMKAFANYGFPESHSVSFAYLVYASSWIKYHEPAAFCAALLNAQPMGFWSPHTPGPRRPPPRRRSSAAPTSTPRSPPPPWNRCHMCRPNSRTRQCRIRASGCGLAAIGLRECAGWATSWRRRSSGGASRTGRTAIRRTSLRRVPALTSRHLETMATAGVFGECFGLDRRRGAVGGRRRRPVATRPARRDRHRRQRTATAVDEPRRGGGRRPVVDRHHPRRPPHPVPARPARRARRAHVDRPWTPPNQAAGSRSPASSPTVSAR